MFIFTVGVFPHVIRLAPDFLLNDDRGQQQQHQEEEGMDAITQDLRYHESCRKSH
jgi:hypothetical protein